MATRLRSFTNVHIERVSFQNNRAPVSGFQGILLDEADGVNRTQQPVLPAGFQAPKIVVSSWNRKV